jgi:hypothetical protein
MGVQPHSVAVCALHAHASLLHTEHQQLELAFLDMVIISFRALGSLLLTLGAPAHYTQ